jgi:hypothetical protein
MNALPTSATVLYSRICTPLVSAICYLDTALNKYTPGCRAVKCVVLSHKLSVGSFSRQHRAIFVLTFQSEFALLTVGSDRKFIFDPFCRLDNPRSIGCHATHDDALVSVV